MSSAERFRLLVESVRDYAIFMLDTEGYVRSWNPGAERAKGYTPSEIIGQHFSAFYTPEDRAAGLPQRMLETAVRLGRHEQEGWRVRKDGTRFWADVVVTAMIGTDGKLLGFSKVTRDMTEKRLLTASRDEALRASQAKSAFLANMSHELRTPLNAIIGYSEMVAEELREAGLEQLASDVLKIRYSGQHLLSIVSDVLDLSRIESGGLQLTLEPVALPQIVAEVIETVRPLASRNGNTVKAHIDESCCNVLADPVRLRQVIYNIFSNACKFTQRGEISLTVMHVAAPIPSVAISIHDTGIGMSPEQRERLFERFYTVEGAFASTGSTGLGLAISKLLIDGMGGEIRVASEMGEGSTFTILLPLA